MRFATITIVLIAAMFIVACASNNTAGNAANTGKPWWIDWGGSSSATKTQNEAIGSGDNMNDVGTGSGDGNMGSGTPGREIPPEPPIAAPPDDDMIDDNLTPPTDPVDPDALSNENTPADPSSTF
jgi:hypothetical protein